MPLKYAYNGEGETARAYGRALSISTKHSVEICRNINGKALEKAKKYLSEVIEKKRAVKMMRYNRDLAHKKSIGPGRYPVKAAKEILKVLENAESNAQVKGMGNDLVIVHISANKASRSWHFGRKRRRKNKRTHIQVVLGEIHKVKPEVEK